MAPAGSGAATLPPSKGEVCEPEGEIEGVQVRSDSRAREATAESS
jgi:hypothetical protein